jgi:hypothetical protein
MINLPGLRYVRTIMPEPLTSEQRTERRQEREILRSANPLDELVERGIITYQPTAQYSQ